MNTIRKNITLSIEDYETINDYAKKYNKSFSEFLKDSALKIITQNEKLSLLDYFNANCDYVDEQEQKEIEGLDIDFDDLSGKELTLKDII